MLDTVRLPTLCFNPHQFSYLRQFLQFPCKLLHFRRKCPFHRHLYRHCLFLLSSLQFLLKHWSNAATRQLSDTKPLLSDARHSPMYQRKSLLEGSSVPSFVLRAHAVRLLNVLGTLELGFPIRSHAPSPRPLQAKGQRTAPSPEDHHKTSTRAIMHRPNSDRDREYLSIYGLPEGESQLHML